jgi:hypothetical protein
MTARTKNSDLAGGPQKTYDLFNARLSHLANPRPVEKLVGSAAWGIKIGQVEPWPGLPAAASKFSLLFPASPDISPCSVRVREVVISY